MDKCRKYLFTIRSLTGGGAERVVCVLTSRLAEDGYDVSIITYERSEHDYPISDKVKIYCMPKAQDNLLGKAARVRDMRRLILQIQPDVIIPFVGTVQYVTWLASLKERTPLIRTVRNSPWEDCKDGMAKIFDNSMYRYAKAIMVQNEEQIEFFDKKLRSKIFVVPNPIDDLFVEKSKRHYSDRIERIVTAGRLVPQKNHPLLIQAFAQVASKHPEIRLEIYGRGPEENKLKDLIRQLGLEDKCMLRGRADNISDILTQADLFVMSSDFEGMPNALMEAMALGLPCISSDCKTGPKTLIRQHQTGMLFPTGDCSALAECLEQAMGNPERMNRMGKAAREHILENYAAEKAVVHAKKMFEYLQSL